MGLKVLAIDDSPATLSLIVDILSRQNYTVETAKNGQEGLEKYVQFKPDIVTIDLTMPTMDGYETMKRLKQIDPFAKIIMLTAAENSAALKRSLQEGASDFLSKPFKAAELANTIRRVRQDKIHCDRDAAAFFALLNNRLASVFGKTFLLKGISLELKDVLTIKNIDPKATDNLGMSDEAGIYPPDDRLSFITQVVGQRECMVSLHISATTLNLLFGWISMEDQKTVDKVLEFSNIVNLKVVSELANAMQIQLDGKPTLFFSNPSAMTSFWRETARMWERIVQGVFEIDYLDNRMSFSIRIWYDGGLFE